MYTIEFNDFSEIKGKIERSNTDTDFDVIEGLLMALPVGKIYTVMGIHLEDANDERGRYFDFYIDEDRPDVNGLLLLRAVRTKQYNSLKIEFDQANERLNNVNKAYNEALKKGADDL